MQDGSARIQNVAAQKEEVEERDVPVPHVGPDGVWRWMWRGMLHRDQGDLPAVVFPDGSEQWYSFGKLHRGHDLPAVRTRTPTGYDLEWWVDGVRHRAQDQHRDDAPAVLRASGDRSWWVRGALHRGADFPAASRANGDQEWWVDGVRHRDYGRPAVVWAGSTHREYWVRGVRHRADDLPAFEYVTQTLSVWQWWEHGLRHRSCGPAVCASTGLMEWWVRGVFLSRCVPVPSPYLGFPALPGSDTIAAVRKRLGMCRATDRTRPFLDGYGVEFLPAWAPLPAAQCLLESDTTIDAADVPDT